MRKNTYDLIIIGGGVSGCVFISSLLENGYKGKVAIIENGRNLGGRCSSRISLKNNGCLLNHGSPNFNILNKKNDQLLLKFLNHLLEKKLITFDDSSVFEIDNYLNIFTNNKNPFYKGNIYRPQQSMKNLLEKLLEKGIKSNQIDLYFSTLITDLNFENKNWTVCSKKGEIYRAKFIVSSSNLILHNRSIKILKRSDIPIRNAIPLGKNKNIDEIINLLNKQYPLKRVNYLIYTNKLYSYKNSYKNRDIHFLFNNEAEYKFGFERIIFQKFEEQPIGIVIHTKVPLVSNENKFEYLSEEILIERFNKIFQHNNLINKLNKFENLSIMEWRASQPTSYALPINLQICEEFKIAFCGDWFDYSGFGRVEGAIISALNLSLKIKNLL